MKLRKYIVQTALRNVQYSVVLQVNGAGSPPPPPAGTDGWNEQEHVRNGWITDGKFSVVARTYILTNE
jgi:hypothetical protein